MTEVLRDGAERAEFALDGLEQFPAGGFPPLALAGVLRVGRNRPVPLEPFEVVDADHVHEVVQAAEPPDPPTPDSSVARTVGSAAATVRDLVLDTGMSPLPRCNTAQASFVLREDFEALLNDVRDEPDQTPLEREMRADAERVVETYGSDPHVSDRDLVEARVVLDAFETLGVADGASPAAE